MWQEITDKNQWRASASFLQSWQWGEFQASLGREVKRLSWEGKSPVQAIKMPLPGGFFYWYIPRGPVVAEAWDELGALFLRVDPVSATPPPLPSSERRGVMATQPQCTLLLNLKQSSDELLNSFHSKTRYNISLAQKKGVTVNAGSIDDFLQLNHVTTQRDNFVAHADAYYRRMIQTLGNTIKIWQASYENKVIASALVIYSGDTVTYLHGASSNEHRNVMAPHLLHYTIITDAQKQGFQHYDWWGVNPSGENHPAYKKSWEGITRFKQGFGGKEVCYPASFDLIYRQGWYSVYRLFSKLRRLV